MSYPDGFVNLETENGTPMRVPASLLSDRVGKSPVEVWMEYAAGRIERLEAALRDIIATESYALDFEALRDCHRRAKQALEDE